MTAHLNRVLLIGRIAGEVELHQVARTGKPIARFPLVTMDYYTDRDSGLKVERAEHHRVVVKNEALANFAARALRRGSHVFVEGSNETRSFVSQGERRIITEVVIGRFKCTLDLLDHRPADLAEPPEPPAEAVPWA